MRRTALTSIILILFVLFSMSSCYKEQATSSSESSMHALAESSIAESLLTDNSSGGSKNEEEQLSIHFFDVGQGDSVFIEFPDDRCMLIDASVSKYEETIENNIRTLGYDRIDYVVATHPHADHIGGMTHILDSFEIGCIYLPDVSASTKTFTTMAETILDKDIEAIVAEAGVTVISEEDMQATFLAPFSIDESDLNKNSAVLHLTYGETSFLFMGDADIEIEQQIGNVDCDVLKVGHHGSRTASDTTFLQHASPQYAIISCGEGNSYGHPHTEALSRLENSGAEILRTDLLGNITVHSDGSMITVYSGDEELPEQSYSENETVLEQSSEETEESETSSSVKQRVLNTNSKKIHEPDCRHVKDIADKNREETTKTVMELEQEGYSACGTCKPHD